MANVSGTDETEEPCLLRRSMPLLWAVADQQRLTVANHEVADNFSQGQEASGLEFQGHKDLQRSQAGSYGIGTASGNSTSGSNTCEGVQLDDSTSRMAVPQADPKKFIDNNQQIPANVSKSKNAKFHKLFKNLPVNEYPIDSFSCAFKGDILLQGLMYVSPNWICFHSNIRARGRLLEIPLAKVISITREKLALFIPNAIGIQTADQKYVFGSFMSRDNTYKLLITLWKHSQDSSDSASNKENELSIYEDFAVKTGRHSLAAGVEDDLTNCADISAETDTTEDEMQDAEFMDDVALNQPQYSPLLSSAQNGLGQSVGDERASDSFSSHPNEKVPGFFSLRCVDCRRLFGALSVFTMKVQKVPRTNLLLAVCSVLVVFLMMSAMGLTYKILLLQTRLEVGQLWNPAKRNSFREETMDSIYVLHSQTHLATVHQLHNILKANIQLLEKVHQSLKSLQGPPWEQECPPPK